MAQSRGWREKDFTGRTLGGAASAPEGIRPDQTDPGVRGSREGTASEVAEKVEIATAAPKGVVEIERLTASLKRCPDTKRGGSAASEAVPSRYSYSALKTCVCEK